MICLATSGEPGFVPSLVELEPPASPYSIDTMAKLSRSLDDCESSLYFIAGADSMVDITGWRQGKKLLSLYNFVFVSRPGVRAAPESVLPRAAVERVRDFTGTASDRVRQSLRRRGTGPAGIFMLDVGAPDISASHIRELVSGGKRFSHLVPGPVHEYIRKLHLYGEQ